MDSPRCFSPPLAFVYTRNTVSVSANVAEANHGESVAEVLGSGDAAQAFQKFTLKQPPLTYVPAANETGAVSTLQVRVNDILWSEAPSFFEHAPDERIYIARQGLRLHHCDLRRRRDRNEAAYGAAEHRSGVPQRDWPRGARQGRPVDAASRASARRKGCDQPAAIVRRTGSRIARRCPPQRAAPDPHARPRSLASDYEDFARAFSGIGKALATFTWTGQSRSIFLTVAGVDGAAVDPAGALYEKLVNALAAAGDPGVVFTVQSYRPALFRVAGTLTVDPAYIASNVLAAAGAALRAAFSFDAREFGQPVSLSEVYAVIQSVPGVIAADIDQLYRSDDQPGLHPLLAAALPRAGGDSAAPAELLTLDPGPVGLQQAAGVAR